MESVKWLESQLRAWRRLVGELQQATGEAGRSQLLSDLLVPLRQAQAALTEIEAIATTEVWRVLQQVGDRVQFLEPTATVLAQVPAIQDKLRLDPADALVLATVIGAQADGLSSNFMSQDKAFSSPDLRDELREHGIVYYPDARSFLRAMR